MSQRIPLANGGFVLVDDEDVAWASRHRWYNSRGYAKRVVRQNGRHRTYQMHREILNAPSGLDVDHINQDGLDNRRSNLRAVEHWRNVANQRPNPKRGTSRFKGVSWSKGNSRWAAWLSVQGKTKYLGYFDVEEDAARAYDAAARERYGECACLNFPEAA